MSMVTGHAPIKGYFARIYDGEVAGLLDHQFNPTEQGRTITADYNFSSPPAAPIPTATFKGIQGNQFAVTLLLDAVETYDNDLLGTTARKAFYESLVSPEFEDFSDDLGQFTPPPRARFGMGEESWEVVVLSVAFRDVRWNTDMIPTRTWVDIQMRTAFVDVAALRARYDFLATYRRRVEFF